jgi:hypothetical protein
MDLKLTELRQRAIRASTAFLKMQRAYLKTAALSSMKSSAELKEAAVAYRKAAEPYDDALRKLYAYLLAAAPSTAVATELERTERLISMLDEEKTICAEMIARHTDRAKK